MMKLKNQNLFLIVVLTISLFLMNKSLLASPGDFDTTFGNNGFVTTKDRIIGAFALQADGKIVVFSKGFYKLKGDCFIISRYNIDGSPDPTFNQNGETPISVDAYQYDAKSIIIQSDGRILAVGNSAKNKDLKEREINLIRLLPNGDLDTTFNGSGVVTTQISSIKYSWAEDAKIQPDGRIIVIGNKHELQNGKLKIFPSILRYNSVGSLDTAFGNGGIITLENTGEFGKEVSIGSDGKMLIKTTERLMRLVSNGAPDFTFGKKGTAQLLQPNWTSLSNLSFQNDEKIIVAGSYHRNKKSFYMPARYNSDGFGDSSFNPKGFLQADTSENQHFRLSGLVIEPNGKIIVGGTNYAQQARLIRFDKNGVLDSSFGNGGKIITFPLTDFLGELRLATQSDGKVILVASCATTSTSFIARFLTE